MTERDRADKYVSNLMHQSHLRYQRQALKADVTGMPSSEIRGLTREKSRREQDIIWLPEWSTHLRPNFWKAYFETLTYMAK